MEDKTHQILKYNHELEQIIDNLILENNKLKNNINKENILFCDFMKKWLEIHKMKLEDTTYNSYQIVLNKHILPYFKDKNLYLNDIKPKDIQEYYSYKFDSGLSSNTILKHHANIRKALDYAYRTDLINFNPADKIDKPKKEKYNANFLNPNELLLLIDLFKNTSIYVPVLLSSVLGLRRSETLGLKWENIDFINKTILINHKVVITIKNGKQNITFKNKLKNDSSIRLLKSPNFLIDELKIIKEKQDKEKIHQNEEFIEYICVRNNGEIINPTYLTKKFKEIISKNNFKKIRFHDLRHTSASTLYNLGYSLKDIQEWLGHSTISTTSDIYTHIDISRKMEIANGIDKLLRK